MKRGTTPTLKINIPKINIDEISRIDFIFKSAISETTPPIILKSYPGNVTYDNVENVFLMPFTEAETRFFSTPNLFFDTKIICKSGKIPAAEIVKINILPTLFGEDDTDDSG